MKAIQYFLMICFLALNSCNFPYRLYSAFYTKKVNGILIYCDARRCIDQEVINRILEVHPNDTIKEIGISNSKYFVKNKCSGLMYYQLDGFKMHKLLMIEGTTYFNLRGDTMANRRVIQTFSKECSKYFPETEINEIGRIFLIGTEYPGTL